MKDIQPASIGDWLIWANDADADEIQKQCAQAVLAAWEHGLCDERFEGMTMQQVLDLLEKEQADDCVPQLR